MRVTLTTKNIFKNNVYNAHDFAKKTGVVCLRLDRCPLITNGKA